MKSKKVMAVCLAITMMLSVAACGSAVPDEESGQKDTSSVTEESMPSSETKETVETGSEVPAVEEKVNEKPAEVKVNDISELSREEKTAWTAYFFQAMQNLDVEVLNEYYVYDFTPWVEGMDSEDRAFFDKIFGAMYYLPEYDIVIGKDPYYMLAMAYRENYTDTAGIDLVATNEEDAAKWGQWTDVTREFATDIMDKYWDEAPYIVLDRNTSDMLSIKDGKLLANYRYASLNSSQDSYVGYDYFHLSHIFDVTKSGVKGLNYGALLFGSVYTNKYTNYIPKGAYKQFYGRLEEYTAENFYDIEAFLEVYKQVDPSYSGNCALYYNFLNNAPDDTNYKVFVENYKNGRYKMAVMDMMIMYYYPAHPERKTTTYYYTDSKKETKIPLDQAFYDFCEQEGIVFYDVVEYVKTDGKSCVIYPLSQAAGNMEKEGLLTRYTGK